MIVGGGASGLMAGIAAARQGSKVTIIEHKDRIGKKILATGNGKCNYTNLYQEPECYRGEDSTFAMKVLSHFDIECTIDYFKQLGIYPKNKNGYLYPNSEQASSVLDVICMELTHLNIEVICNEKVESITKRNDIFYIRTNQANYNAKKVILSTGGMASSELGSDGSGYQLAKQFGHKIIKPVPALVQLKSNASYFKSLAGVRVNANLSLYVEDQLVAKENGELQLTNYGVSGIPIFQLSRFASRAIEEKKTVHIIIDFLPELAKEEVYKLLLQRIEQGYYKTVEQIFTGLLNKKLANVIIKEAKVSQTLLCSAINKRQINSLVNKIKVFKVEITEPNSFKNAQVCAGGVDTKEVKDSTLESLLVKGLYITGELLDIDGICGGYNLQWAWSTGILAGMDAGSKR